MNSSIRHIEPVLPGPPGQTVSPTAIASAEAFGAAQLNLKLTATAIASAEAFGSDTVTPGNVNVSPSAITSGEAFGTPVVHQGDTLLPPAITSGEALGTPTVTPGNVNVTPTAITSAGALGTPTVTPGNVNVSPTAITSGEAFGTALIVQQLIVSPPSIDSGEVIGALGVLRSGLRALPPAIVSGEALGHPTVTLSGTSTISPPGIPSAAAAGVHITFQIEVAGGGGVPGVPPLSVPRNVLIDRVSGEIYPWPVNHATEDAVKLGRQLARSGVNPGGFMIRQPQVTGPIRLTLHGSLVAHDQAQYHTFVRFFDESDDRTFDYIDAAGDSYHVVITQFDARRKMSPAHLDGSYFEYTLVVEVLEVNDGAYRFAGV